MNTIIEKIKTWVNQRKKELHSTLFNDEYNDFLSFLSDLEKEEKPMELDFERELYKHFGQVKDFTLGMRIGQYFYELGRQSKRNIEICPHSIKSKSYAMNKPKVCEGLEEEAVSYCFDNGLNLSPMVATDFARHFARWGAEHCLKSEFLAKFAEMTGSIDTMPKNTLPPSKECEQGLRDHLDKDLEEASDEYAEKHGFRVPYDGSDNFYDNVDVKASKDTFIAGAKWQKEQMMKEAVDSGMTVGDINRKLWYVPEDFKVVFCKEGDKVKLIIVKED